MVGNGTVVQHYIIILVIIVIAIEIMIPFKKYINFFVAILWIINRLENILRRKYSLHFFSYFVVEAIGAMVNDR